MKLLKNKATGAVLGVSDNPEWEPQIPDFAELVEFVGQAETFPWPGGSPSAAKIDGKGDAVKNDSVVKEKTLSIAALIQILLDKRVITQEDVDGAVALLADVVAAPK